MNKWCNCKNPAIIYDLCGFKCNRCQKPIKISTRKTWQINPRTKIKKSNKIYNRKKAKRKLRKQSKEEQDDF